MLNTSFSLSYIVVVSLTNGGRPWNHRPSVNHNRLYLVRPLVLEGVNSQSLVVIGIYGSLHIIVNPTNIRSQTLQQGREDDEILPHNGPRTTNQQGREDDEILSHNGPRTTNQQGRKDDEILSHNGPRTTTQQDNVH